MKRSVAEANKNGGRMKEECGLKGNGTTKNNQHKN